MELILWRHADAEPGVDDLERKLTAKGRKQAARVGGWLQCALAGEIHGLFEPGEARAADGKSAGRADHHSELLVPGTSAADILRAVSVARAR
jgi:phosphohistidine phosphatase